MTPSKPETDNNQAKAPYEKPRLTRVRLVPEEAVLTACKVQDGFINAFLFDYCGIALQCSQPGS